MKETTFHCDYCNTDKSISEHYETWGTGMQECNCCAKACSCHPQCNCYINSKNCPECATTEYSRTHGGTAMLLSCDCGAGAERGEYGVDFGAHKVCVKCTDMSVTVLHQ